MTSTAARHKTLVETQLISLRADRPFGLESIVEATFYAPFYDDPHIGTWEDNYARYRVVSVPAHSRRIHLYDIVAVHMVGLMPDAYQLSEASGYKTLRIEPLSPVAAWSPALIQPYLKVLNLPTVWRDDGACVALPAGLNMARLNLMRAHLGASLRFEVV